MDTDQPPASSPRRPRFAVAYLARHAEGLTTLQEFRDSFNRHAPGLEHTLVIIYKGFEKPTDLQTAKAVFAALPHVALEISDEGFDITAYLKAAHSLDYDYFCFLNTHTRIIAPGWLALLGECVTQPGVGIAGAMGSYESIADSWRLITKVAWLCNEQAVKYDPLLVHYYDYIIENGCRSWLKRERRRKIFDPRDLAAALGLARRRPQKNWRDISEAAFQKKWLELRQPGGPYFEHALFPAFPNPHIRSNGFIVAREHLIKRQASAIKSKLDACRFESGPDSLTIQIQREGLRAVVVTRDGKYHEVADWPRSATFRLGQQEGLILTDNQSRIFDQMTPGTSATHVRASWGDYLGPPPPDFPDLGFKFSALPGGALPRIRPPVWAGYLATVNSPRQGILPGDLKFSFLIPSKNRLSLLKFAVESILRQDYAQVEIIVADNASDDDYEAYIKQLRDSRIKYLRTPTAVSVTANWDRSLQQATGDYILMLGDDDALAPGFIRCVVDLIGRHARPDIVYSAAYHYGYPHVVPSNPEGYLAEISNSVFFKNQTGPFLLSIAEARRVARAIGDLRYLFGFNSQHFLFRAEFLKSIRLAGGPATTGTPAAFPAIFQSPFPDFFAAMVTFMNARSVLVVPDPLVIIGISPKSFGYYYFNDQLKDGYKFLDNDQVSPEVRDSLKGVLLPGDQLNSLWLIAAESARRAMGAGAEVTVNIERYRQLQIVAFLRGIFLKKSRLPEETNAFAAALSPEEQTFFTGLMAEIAQASRVSNDDVIRIFERLDRQLEQYCPAQVIKVEIGHHKHMGHAFQALLDKYPASPGSPVYPPQV